MILKKAIVITYIPRMKWPLNNNALANKDHNISLWEHLWTIIIVPHFPMWSQIENK